jgi:hypothetical protein
MKPKTRILLVVVILALYSSIASAGTIVTASGFNKIKPQFVSTNFFSNGTFTSLFLNDADYAIFIRDVRGMDENSTEVTCRTSINSLVPPGGDFRVSLDGCNLKAYYYGKNIGIFYSEEVYTYRIKIELDYNTTVDGSKSQTDVGTIRWPNYSNSVPGELLSNPYLLLLIGTFIIGLTLLADYKGKSVTRQIFLIVSLILVLALISYLLYKIGWFNM